MTQRKIHVVGNWKMNMNVLEIKEFVKNIQANHTREIWIAPQAVHIPILIDLQGDKFISGGQDCSDHDSGAYTGEISPQSLVDIGAKFVLIGHSERRQYQKENNELLNRKVKSAIKSGLKVIFCVGESLELREEGSTEATIKHQLVEGLKNITTKEAENILIAYEPVWAIGTGKVATPVQAQEVHHYIRNEILEHLNFKTQDTIILYGGSVKPDNFSELLNCEDIDGALVGGASLNADSFNKLIHT
ncbi:MAG: triose-phosphate isomerase [Halobacteriovoraceae bacterium]|nr:triose-phosphate isomerase [Halobacteriovoraceae bacterium]